jgi:hypothetical protein
MIEKSYFQDLLDNGVPETIPQDGFTFEDLFDEFVAGSQKKWAHDRSKSIGASEAFSCIRKAWFGKRGAEFGFVKDPEYKESWGAMRRGDLIENHHVVPAVESGLKRRGMELILAGEGQSTIVDGLSSATLDGLIKMLDGSDLPPDFLSYYGIPVFKGKSVVLEMKSFDPRINITEAKAVHEGQTQMQMGLIRETTEHQPDYAVVIYVNASWLDDIRPYVVAFDQNVFEIGKRRAEKVFTIDDPALLGAEGKLDGMCTYCAYKNSCDIVSVGRVPPKREPLKKGEVAGQDQILLKAMNEPVLRIAELKSVIKGLERELEEENENIRQLLIGSNESRAVGDGWKASYTVVNGRKTLSKDMIEAAGLDPEKFMTEGAGYEKLTVTVEKAAA